MSSLRLDQVGTKFNPNSRAFIPYSQTFMEEEKVAHFERKRSLEESPTVRSNEQLTKQPNE